MLNSRVGGALQINPSHRYAFIDAGFEDGVNNGPVCGKRPFAISQWSSDKEVPLFGMRLINPFAESDGNVLPVEHFEHLGLNFPV